MMNTNIEMQKARMTIEEAKAAMKAAKEAKEAAEKQYEEMKAIQFAQVIKILESGGCYTAAELSTLTGIDSAVIATNLYNGSHSKTMRRLGSPYIRHGTRTIEDVYVRKLPDGTYDEAHKMKVRRDVNDYYMPDAPKQKPSQNTTADLVARMIEVYERS